MQMMLVIRTDRLGHSEGWGREGRGGERVEGRGGEGRQHTSVIDHHARAHL